jgi:hypothetical protein
MIDFQREQVLPLSQLRALILLRFPGRQVHLATLYNWTTVGFRGVVLESLQAGGARCSSLAALQRFFERVSEVTSARHQTKTSACSAGHSEKANCQLTTARSGHP